MYYVFTRGSMLLFFYVVMLFKKNISIPTKLIQKLNLCFFGSLFVYVILFPSTLVLFFTDFFFYSLYYWFKNFLCNKQNRSLFYNLLCVLLFSF